MPLQRNETPAKRSIDLLKIFLPRDHPKLKLSIFEIQKKRAEAVILPGQIISDRHSVGWLTTNGDRVTFFRNNNRVLTSGGNRR